jgi:hypothetical protein
MNHHDHKKDSLNLLSEKILESSTNAFDVFSRNPCGRESPITKPLPTQKKKKSDFIRHHVNLHINNNVSGEISLSVFKSNPSSVINLKIEAARFDETSVLYLKSGIFISTAVRMSVSKAASQNDVRAPRAMPL